MPSTLSLVALAFSAGTATFFAPCAFPLVPGYVSFYLGTSAETATDGGTASGSPGGLLDRRVARSVVRAVGISAVVSAGMVTVYAAVAGVAVGVGSRVLADIAALEAVVGATFVLAGGLMAAGWKPSGRLVRLPRRRRTLGGFFAFGALYAAAAAGCTAPLFVAVVVRTASAGPQQGLAVATAYAGGMGAVMTAVTVVTALGGTALLSRLSGYTDAVYRVAGALLVLSGGAEIYYYRYGFPAWAVV